MNLVVLTGYLGEDPKKLVTSGGNSMSKFSVATTDKYDGKTTTDWHQVMAFGKIADVCNEYLQKGALVCIHGKLKTRTWVNSKTGEKNKTTNVVISTIQMFGGSKVPLGKTIDDTPITDDVPDDIPF